MVRENQLIAVEDLAVAGLARTRLARSVHDAGWSTFVQMLAYKAQRAGRMLVKIDRRPGAAQTGIPAGHGREDVNRNACGQER